jgi:hypothetical protein
MGDVLSMAVAVLKAEAHAVSKGKKAANTEARVLLLGVRQFLRQIMRLMQD